MTDMGVKDPLWRAIERELGRRLDPLLFERCAVHLLQEAYPRLTPVSGPGDGGIDGAIATDGGPPMILVCTTSPDVIGNLTKNLKSYKAVLESHEAIRGASRYGASAAAGPTSEPPGVVVATSQPLTPRQRRNLEQRADELGFDLKNIHDRDDFVGRLYRGPPIWRMELLGLTGELPALSVYPCLSAYPGQLGWDNLEVLGRDEELDWMRRQEGDYVLVGQPGVGKTTLLRVLAREGYGLFAATEELHRIADAYRESQPQFVFLPDAHLRADLLRGLLDLRLQLGAQFKIAATTWPSREREIAYDWTPTRKAPTRKAIDPLPRDVLAQIVRSTVGAVSDPIVAEVLDQSTGKPGLNQSKGKPGLAVRLAEAAIKAREIESVARGAVLLTYLERNCKLIPHDMDILACVALGGEQGMTLASAARALEVAPTYVKGVLPKVSGTGFLVDSLFSGSPLSITPAALRDALVARTFFSGARSLDVGRALDAVYDATSATETLISVLARRAARREPELHRLIRMIRSRLPDDPRDRAHRNLWQAYARVGRKEAVLWILDHHRDLVDVVARPALDFAPVHSLPLLLSRVANQGVRRVLEDWLTEPAFDLVKRRRQVLEELQEIQVIQHRRPLDAREMLLDEARSENRSDEPDETNLLALIQTVFSLELNDFGLDRVAMNEIAWRVGPPPLSQVQELFKLWPSACRLLQAWGQAGVEAARGIAVHWCRAANKETVSTSDEWCAGVRNHARRMVADVVALADERPGIVLWAKRTAEATGIDVELPPLEPDVADVLPHYRMQKAAEGADSSVPRNDESVVMKRAAVLASGEARTGVRELMRLAEEAQLAGHHPGHIRLLTFLEAVAERVADPVDWTRELVDRSAHPQWVAPCLLAAVARGLWSEKMWGPLLGNDQYRDLAIWTGLQHGNLPGPVVEYIWAGLVEGRLPAMSWKMVHEEWKLRLLRTERRDLAVRAAGAMWRSDDVTVWARPVLLAWLNVMAECEDESLLVDVFLSQSPMAQKVAKAWFLVSRAELRVDRQTFLDKHTFDLAASLLNRESRVALVRAIPPGTARYAVLALVGQDDEVYQVLLDRKDLSDMHLLPLRDSDAGDAGLELAVRARQAGYSIRQIADNILWQQVSAFPDDSQWRLRERMEAWASHVDASVQRIAELVLERAYG